MKTRPPNWFKNWSIPTCLATAQSIRDEVIKELQQENWPEGTVIKTQTAIDEALMNAIQHGNKQDPHKKIHLSCQVTPKAIVFSVQDEGTGFDPASVPDPTTPEHLEQLRGRGILLMKVFTDYVYFSHQGTKVTITVFRPIPAHQT